ncbi:dynein axonemal heavy chain 12 [Astyanax mexicanus]|uniref:Dynein heavy chain 12, axonemal-like n=1 Tax=Astyanax mexicanus TaxID=7994 RepID=A0A8B9L9Y2_ASTMX|nr:dynein axonemal heavy chain 12 [Astyanax mexicanus]KAG9269583.1 dynein heavy chain 12, axonemal-like [Astyanax mexicanus]
MEEVYDTLEEDWDDEDEATQYMIEQSLLECGKCSSQTPSDPALENIDHEEIFTAIQAGNEDALRLLVQHREAMSMADSRGWIPLHEAAIQQKRSILEITFSASPQGSGQCRTLKGETPLFLAVVNGLRENATFLLQNGCSPDCTNEDEDSPLLAAIKNDQYDLASLLLRFNATVDQTGSLQRTALHEASLLGLEDYVYLLLQSGANPNACDASHHTPLGLAAQAGHLNVVEVLLQKGARIWSNPQSPEAPSVLFEAAASGNPDIISVLLEYGADPNAPTHTGHLPIHRAAYRGHLLALENLIPVTKKEAIKESGMSPLHSAAAGGHFQCLELLLDAGFDPNFMLHPRVRRNYDDERRSALYFAVSNNDVQSARMLLEAGAMANQDPVSCLQVAVRLGNYELIHTLLRYGANVNYYSRVNTTHFPSALQYALKDEVMLRMLLNHGYDVQRCFECPYGQGLHLPAGYEGWSPSVIKDVVFCEVITVSWLQHIAGHVVRIMLDYVDHVTFCSKLKSILVQQKQWPDICSIQENTRSLKHLCRLKIRESLGRLRLRAPVFISFLPLPNSLKDYIRFKEYDIYSRGSGGEFE